jgi:hypothetical protein
MAKLCFLSGGISGWFESISIGTLRTIAETAMPSAVCLHGFSKSAVKPIAQRRRLSYLTTRCYPAYAFLL